MMMTIITAQGDDARPMITKKHLTPTCYSHDVLTIVVLMIIMKSVMKKKDSDNYDVSYFSLLHHPS